VPALVVAPDAVVRFRGGRLHVHTGGPQRAYASDDPDLFALLARFATPREPEDALAAAPEGSRPALRAALDRLTAIGALVPATAEPRPGPDPVDAFVAPLADAVHRLAGDLAGLGPFAREALAARTGVPLDDRLLALLAGVTSLEAELRELRADHLSRQLAALGLTPDSRGLRLHLGAGGQRLPGWINVDAHPSELALDLKWGLPFGDGAADLVFMSHMLEHFFYPEETLAVLAEIRRVLAPEGRLRVVVPDVEQCLRAYASDDAAFFEEREKTWTWWRGLDTRLVAFLSYAGVGPRPSHFLESHKFGYDYDTLAHALRQAGFSRVERSSFQGSAEPALRVDEASLVAGATHAAGHYSLFVEARR